MDQTAFDDVISEIGRDVVAQLAPSELILYRAKCELYFKDRPTRRIRSSQSDEALGIGTAEIVTMMTPVILSALGDVIRMMADEIAKKLGMDAGDLLSKAIRKLFKRWPDTDSASSEVFGLTQKQLARAHSTAFAAALRWDCSQDQAQKVADTIVANLVTATEGGPLG